MIDLMLKQANEIVIVRIEGNKVSFGSTIYGAKMATIDGLRLDFNGTIREFPDLKDNIEWRRIAIERFKKKIKTMKNEDEISKYIIEELRTKGYQPYLKQVQGHRPVRIT